MKNYAHQQKIIDEDPKRTGLWLGTGSGKTRTALQLATGLTLVICPKTQKEDGNWEREWKTLQAQESGKRIGGLCVLSKETFKRDHATMAEFETVIVDEAHTCLGVTPNTRQRNKVVIPKTSQIFEALDAYVRRTKPKRLYLCTATIVKSPMTVWAAYCLLKPIPEDDVTGSWFAFRAKYYVKLPMPGRDVWMPKKDSETKDALAKFVHSLGYVGRLEDYFDVPEQTFRTEYMTLSVQQRERIKELPIEYPDPIVLIGKKHQVENGVLAGDEYNAPELFGNEKVNRILELAEEFPRMVVFVKYSEQIRQIEVALQKAGYETLHLTGQTTNRGEAIAAANKMEQCVFIAQAQMSAGWQLPSYPVMVFASRTYSYVDYSQALGRIQRADNIKKNLYINLVVKGGIDDAVDKALANKQDFDERLYV